VVVVVVDSHVENTADFLVIQYKQLLHAQLKPQFTSRLITPAPLFILLHPHSWIGGQNKNTFVTELVPQMYYSSQT
jgi:hypothetical protein